MLFERLLVQNLGIFRGVHSLQLLPTDANHPIVLVGALNGSGKTTVIESIQLALYGKRATFGWRGAGSYLQYLLLVRNRNAHPTEPTVAEIAVKLLDGRRLRVRRHWSFTKDTPREYVSVFVNDEEHADLGLSENWDDEIERLLPARLSELFFFDGERIESLAESARSGDVLRSAVASLLGLDLVDHLSADLDILRSRQRHKLLANDDQKLLNGVQSELQKNVDSIREIRDKKAELQNRIDRAQLELDRANARLRDEGGERIRQREDTLVKRATLATEIKSIEDRLRDAAAGPLPLALLWNELKDLHVNARKRDMYVSAGAEADVRQHIEQISTWVKSRRFPKPIIDEITEFLAKRMELVPDPDPHFMSADWRRLAIQLESLLEHQLPQVNAEALKLIDTCRVSIERLDQLDELLGRVPEQEQLAESFRLQGALESTLKALSADFRALEAAEQIKLREQTKLIRQREDLLDKAVEAGDAHRVAVYCERALETLATFRSRLVQKRREQLEALILEGFNLLSRKSNLIGKVRLDPDTMTLSLLTQSGETMANQQLSAGERQLLAVSMLWGLARASGRPIPVVIDTPLGRLDGEHRRALVERYFPDASHQVLLLSTDQEVDAGFSRMLDNSVARRYLIAFHPTERTSSFSVGYFTEPPDAG